MRPAGLWSRRFLILLWHWAGLIFLVIPSALAAQSFSILSVTDQGDVYFSSGLQLHVGRPANAGDIFHYSDLTGIEWFLPDWGPATGGLAVSADGRVFASTQMKTTLSCFGFFNCIPIITFTSRI